jgi:hypothetical protein
MMHMAAIESNLRTLVPLATIPEVLSPRLMPFLRCENIGGVVFDAILTFQSLSG